MELILQAFFFVVTFWLLFRRDRFCSIFYLILYIYTLPVEICSGYLPFLLKFDFGKEVYFPFYVFSTLSIFAFWLFVFLKSRTHRIINCVGDLAQHKSINSNKAKLVYYIIVCILIVQGIIILLSLGDISYHHLTSVDYKKSHPLLIAGSAMFLVSKPLALLLLFKYLSSKSFERKFCLFLLLWNISQNFLYGTLAGSRSGILSIMLALFFAVYGYRKVSLKNLIKVGAIGLVSIGLLQGVRSFRSEGEVDDKIEEYAILQNDYADPGLTTLAAIKYEVTEPIEVIFSNIARIFPFVDYPYLYITITEIFAPGLADEANALGFYIFTEGYMFCGIPGFIYNAIVIGGLLLYWRRLGRTNNKLFNLYILSLMISFFFAMVRAQSVWFIRNLWQFIIPMVILYSWFMNIRINYKKLLFH